MRQSRKFYPRRDRLPITCLNEEKFAKHFPKSISKQYNNDNWKYNYI